MPAPPPHPPAPPALRSVAFAGDVTALARAGSVLVAGVGSQLRLFDAATAVALGEAAALPSGCRVHGVTAIDGCPRDAFSTAPPSRAIHWLAVHGDRHARVLALAAGGGRGPALAPACEVAPRAAWTLDALLCGGQGAGGPQPCLLAVGDSDNAVTVFALPAAALAAAAAVAVAAGADAQVSLLPPAGPLATPVLRAACSERSLLFSMSLPSSPTTDLWVAGGTVFLDVLVWRAPPVARRAAAAVGAEPAPAALAAPTTPHPDPPATPCPPLLRLQGHVGSIHRVVWGPGGRTLASGSDDRSLRVWRVGGGRKGAGGAGAAPPSTRTPAPPAVQGPALVLWGHQARLWDAVFLPADALGGEGEAGEAGAGSCPADAPAVDAGTPDSSDPAWVLSTSEDCTVRLWSLADGGCAAVLRGHGGRGVWRAALGPGAGVVATGGADGGVLLWDLASHATGRAGGARVVPVPCGPDASSPTANKPDCSVSSVALAGGPGALLVGGRDGAVWRAVLGAWSGGGSSKAASDGPDPELRWTKLLSAPAAASVVWTACLPCPQDGRAFGCGGSHGGRAAAPADGLPPYATCLLLAAGFGRGGAAVACSCALDCRATTVAALPAVWRACPAAGPPSPVLRTFLPPALQGRVVLTASAAGELSVWVPDSGVGSGEAADAANPRPPPTLVAQAPPRRLRRRVTIVTAADACLHTGLLFATDAAGDVSAYRLPPGLAGDGVRPAAACDSKSSTPALVLLARVSTPDTAAASSLRLLPLRPGPPVLGQARAPPPLRRELAVGDAAGQMTTLRVSAPGTGRVGEPANSPPAVPVLAAVETSRVPGVGAVTADADAGGVRVLSGFQGQDWVAVRAGDPPREVCRVRVASCGRPLCFGAGGSDGAVLAFGPPGKSGATGGRNGLALRVWVGGPPSRWPGLAHGAGAHHGLEAHGVALLPGPGGGGRGAPAAACLTASEDGTLRATPVGGGAARPPSGHRLGWLVDGSALRAVAAAPTPGGRASGDWIVAAAGARDYATAWRVWWGEGGGGGGRGEAVAVDASWAEAVGSNAAGAGAINIDPCEPGPGPALLRADWLATAGGGAYTPGRRSSRGARLAASSRRAEAEQRALDIKVISPAGPTASIPRHEALVVTASSGGSVDVRRLDVGTPAFGAPARLSALESPAICLAVLRPTEPAGPWAGALFAGHADGSVQAWCLAAAADATGDPQAGEEAAKGHPPPPPPPTPPAPAPAATLAAVHQSGVNAAAAAPLAPTSAVLVTGGDDQALAVTWVDVEWGASGRLARLVVAGRASLPCAHASALRGVWTDGRHALSAGLDCRVRAWRLPTAGAGDGKGGAAGSGASGSPEPGDGAGFQELGVAPLQVQNPESLAALAIEDGAAFMVAVAGRGLEALAWRPPATH